MKICKLIFVYAEEKKKRKKSVRNQYGKNPIFLQKNWNDKRFPHFTFFFKRRDPGYQIQIIKRSPKLKNFQDKAGYIDSFLNPGLGERERIKKKDSNAKRLSFFSFFFRLTFSICSIQSIVFKHYSEFKQKEIDFLFSLASAVSLFKYSCFNKR